MLMHNYSERKKRTAVNEARMLRHMRESTFSNTETLASCIDLSYVSAYKILCRFQKKGWVTKYQVPDFTEILWGLTKQGVDASWQSGETVLKRKPFRPNSVSVITIKHELDLQKAKIFAEKSHWHGWIYGHHLSGELAKRPDAVAINEEGVKYSVELERFSKERTRIESIMAAYLQMIKMGFCQYVAYVSPQQNLAKRLKRIFYEIESVPVGNVRVTLLPKHYERFKFFWLEDFPTKEV